MEDLCITSGNDLRLLLGLAGRDDPLIISKVLPIDYCIAVVECNVSTIFRGKKVYCVL